MNTPAQQRTPWPIYTSTPLTDTSANQRPPSPIYTSTPLTDTTSKQRPPSPINAVPRPTGPSNCKTILLIIEVLLYIYSHSSFLLDGYLEPQSQNSTLTTSIETPSKYSYFNSFYKTIFSLVTKFYLFIHSYLTFATRRGSCL